jgi:hypothetical protein
MIQELCMYSYQGRRIICRAQLQEFYVIIDSESPVNFKGLIVYEALKQSQQFVSFLELIHLISIRLDEMGLAQPATEIRSFDETSTSTGRKGTISALKNQHKKDPAKKLLGKPEFMIRLNLRQNATWQGELYWVNADRRIHFRSLLEMVNLMQEAMEISGEPQAESAFRSWYDESTIESTG